MKVRRKERRRLRDGKRGEGKGRERKRWSGDDKCRRVVGEG